MIVTHSADPVIAARMATSVIPIVFGVVGDPVGTGLVSSPARPGGNVIGLSGQTPDLAAKRLLLLREVVPGLVSVCCTCSRPEVAHSGSRLTLPHVRSW